MKRVATIAGVVLLVAVVAGALTFPTDTIVRSIVQQLPLPLGRRPAVAPHRRKHERLRPQVQQHVEGRPDHHLEVRDTAAADADGHAVAALYPAGQSRRGPLALGFRGDVGDNRL